MSPARRPPDAAESTGYLSCTIDADPRFHLEALRWFATATDIAGVSPSDLIVHVAGGETSDVVRMLEKKGSKVRSVQQFDNRSPHCNKISGALSLCDEVDRGLCVLLDSDTLILEDPRSLDIEAGHVGMKVVDHSIPPLRVLRSLFGSAGLPLPQTVPTGSESEEPTLAGNGNGGLYAIPGPLLRTVAHSWQYWARWLLDHLGLLQEWAVHVDQVAMAMALSAEGIDIQPLDVRWNAPIHDQSILPHSVREPAVIHYHSQVDQQGNVSSAGVEALDRQIRNANRAVARIWNEEFPNETFWNWRYQTNPQLGSGAGSRGVALARKRRMIQSVVDTLRPHSIIDLGCGDGYATRDLDLPDYLGIDVSSEAVDHASALHPHRRYRVADLCDLDETADLALCLDVLIHQTDPSTYRRLVHAVLGASHAAVVVSGYEHPLTSRSPMVRFHEPLSTTIRSEDGAAELYPLSRDGDVITWLVLKPPPTRHPRDFTPRELHRIIHRHPDPLALAELRLSSWASTGFYPKHEPRLWEYPIVADLARQLLPDGGTLLDVGAGVTPLPAFLHSRGFVVHTLDPSENVRGWPLSSDCNEWGFLDYAAAGLAGASWNTTLDTLPGDLRYDLVYSVSVIEHLPASTRRALFKDITRHLEPNGFFIATVDLVRDSNKLWNRDRNVTVESRRQHGTLDSIVEELQNLDLELLHVGTQRKWGDVPVDIGLLVASRGQNAKKAIDTDHLYLPLDPPAQSRSSGHRIWARIRSEAQVLGTDRFDQLLHSPLGRIAHGGAKSAWSRTNIVKRAITQYRSELIPSRVAERRAPALLVVGMHRSGTSALAGALASAGIPLTATDDLVVANRFNSSGYFESEQLRVFNDSLLHRLGASWDVPPQFGPEDPRYQHLSVVERRARNVFDHVAPAAGPVMWKDPRTSLLLPFWRGALQRPLVLLFVYRHPEAVGASLLSRDNMSRQEALRLWTTYNRSILQGADGLPLFVVRYESLLDTPLLWFDAIGSFLREHGVAGPVAFAPDTAAAFVDTEFAHYRESVAEHDSELDRAIDLMTTLDSLQGAHDRWTPARGGSDSGA